MPLMHSRRGFTLVELLIALVLLGMVGAITVRMLTDTQRLTVAQGERANVQATNRVGALVMPAELREINPALGDILSMSATSIEYRALRNLAVSCAAPTPTSVVVSAASVGGLRPSFGMNDRILVFVEGDRDDDDDDLWGVGQVSGVAAATCPDGTAGILLSTGALVYQYDGATPVPGAMLATGAPVRAYEHTTLSAYTDGEGRTWLGMEVEGDVVQPVVGPLAADGLQFTYRDANGDPTGTATSVRTIDVAITGQSSRTVHQRGGGSGPGVIVDTISTRVTLRNGL